MTSSKMRSKVLEHGLANIGSVFLAGSINGSLRFVIQTLKVRRGSSITSSSLPLRLWFSSPRYEFKLFPDIANNSSTALASNGLAVGFAWLWLLVILTCCLNAGPRCDTAILRNAVQRANEKAFIAADVGQPPGTSSIGRAQDGADSMTTPEWCPGVFLSNESTLHSVLYRTGQHNIPVALKITWEKGSSGGVDPVNRSGSLEQVVRSGSYLIYAVNSTIIWAMLLTASRLSFSSIVSPGGAGSRLSISAKFAIILRRAAKILASMNAIWIIFFCTFQFAGFSRLQRDDFYRDEYSKISDAVGGIHGVSEVYSTHIRTEECETDLVVMQCIRRSVCGIQHSRQPAVRVKRHYVGGSPVL
ncbi:hypothetical protein DFH09DRAFT_1095221 [Mycena vulgaris]|nr:hypothetical protein DFH09DRAFT_1095221 [Mycena vulgaris]